MKSRVYHAKLPWPSSKKDRPLEKTIEKKACKELRRRGALVFKLNFRSQRSAPDDLVLAPNGVMLMIEFKRLGEKPTELQEHLHERIRSRGHNIAVCDTVEKAIEFYERCEAAHETIIKAVNWSMAAAASVSSSRNKVRTAKRRGRPLVGSRARQNSRHS